MNSLFYADYFLECGGLNDWAKRDWKLKQHLKDGKLIWLFYRKLKWRIWIEG